MREEIYTGGGITIYTQKVDNGYLIYSNADGFMILCDKSYNIDWDFEEEQQHTIKNYVVGTKEYNELINKYFKNV